MKVWTTKILKKPWQLFFQGFYKNYTQFLLNLLFIPLHYNDKTTAFGGTGGLNHTPVKTPGFRRRRNTNPIVFCKYQKFWGLLPAFGGTGVLLPPNATYFKIIFFCKLKPFVHYNDNSKNHSLCSMRTCLFLTKNDSFNVFIFV
jgi:hypothetical protein